MVADSGFMNSDPTGKRKPLALRPAPAYRADVRILLTLALLLTAALTAACTHKEIGELCKDADECEFECKLAILPGAERKICAMPCSDNSDCPEGTNCHVQVYCARNCKSDADCFEGTACDGVRCLPVCQSDDQCGNNGCSTPGKLCDE